MPEPITLTLLSAVTEAVFGHLLQQAEPRVCTWLKREPARLAFQAVFLRAYKAYADRHPQWAAGLLDETFFTRDDVAGELGKLLTRAPGAAGRPDVETLVRSWADYFPVADGDALAAKRAEAAAVLQAFTADLERELGKEEALQPLYDSRALERIAASAESMEAAMAEAAARMTPALQRNVTVQRDLINSIVVTGDRNTINYFTAPARALRTDYRSRVEEFLLEYLGTPDAPVPFGGRDRELQQLSEWLIDGERTPRLLLTAPAGRGKSALLVRWLAGLRGREDLHVVFAPVSIRFRTNLYDVTFAILAHQLAAIYGKEPPGVDEPPEVWRGMVSQLLREPPPDGRGLLLVMDGLDEAAGWEPGPDLFPDQLAPGVCIVASARLTAQRPADGDWLRSLGWERPHPARTFSLAGLDQAGLTDVLVRMGASLDQLGRDVDIVAELYRLTGGDPLLVRFYVEDLWLKKDATARLQPADLRHLEPGYKGYFKRWWEDQRQLWQQTGADAALRERSTREALTLLACALGPLTQADLLALAAPEADLDPWTLEEALRPLARFVVGDRGNGYSLAHPKLGEFFQEEILLDQVPAIEARFVAWGRSVLAELSRGERSPEDTPVYLLEYLSLYLQAADDFNTLATLVESPAWYEASGYHDPSLQLFARDVEQAIEMAEARGLDALPHVVAWSLLYASVCSYATQVPVEALEAMVLLGESERALRYADLITDLKQRVDAYRRIGLRLHEQGRDDEAYKVLQGALAAAEGIVDEDSRAKVMSGVVEAMAEAGDPAGALAAAEGIADGFWRAEALSGVARAIAEMGDLTGAEQVIAGALAAAEGIDDAYWQTKALSNMAKITAEVGDLARALALTKRIGSESRRAEALSSVAMPMAEAGDMMGLMGMLAVAEGVDDEYWQANALSNVARAMTKVGDLAGAKQALAGALAAAEKITDINSQAAALSNVAVAIAKMGDLKRAREVMEKALSEREKGLDVGLLRQEALSGVVALAQVGDRVGALEMAGKIVEIRTRAEALCSVAVAMAKAGDLKEARKALADAKVAATEINDSYLWREVVANMAAAMAQMGDLVGALAAAKQIDDDRRRVQTLLRVTRDTIQRDDILGALTVAQDIDDKRWRAQALAEVAVAKAQAGDWERAREILEDSLTEVEVNDDARWREQAWFRVASAMVQADDLDVIVSALSAEKRGNGSRLHIEALLRAAAEMETNDDTREALVGVAKIIEQTGDLEDALRIAEEIDDARWQSEVLIGLAMALIKDDDLDRAKKALMDAMVAVEKIDDNYLRTRALTVLASVVVQTGDLAWAREILGDVPTVAKKIDNDYWRVEALTKTAAVMQQTDDLEEAKKILRAVIAVVRGINNDYCQAEMLMEVAGVMAQIGDIEGVGYALTGVFAAVEKWDDRWRTKSVLRVADEYFLEEALSTAEEIGDDEDQVEALAMAEVGDEVQFPAWTRNVFAQARQRGRDEVWSHIAAFAPVLGKLGVITPTWQRIQAVEAVLTG